MAAALHHRPNGQASWLWLLAFRFRHYTRELYLSPIGLALRCPRGATTDSLRDDGPLVHHQLTGNQLQGYIGSYFSRMDKVSFFLLCADWRSVRLS